MWQVGGDLEARLAHLRDAYFAIACARNALAQSTALNQASHIINQEAFASARELLGQAAAHLSRAAPDMQMPSVSGNMDAPVGQLRPVRAIEFLSAARTRGQLAAVQTAIRDQMDALAPGTADAMLRELPDPDVRPRWRRWFGL